MDSSITPAGRIPAQVRADGAEGRKLWDAALGFESFLVRTLTQGLTNSVGGDDEDADSATTTSRDQLPDAFASSITANGGLGLAQQLYDQMRTKVIS